MTADQWRRVQPLLERLLDAEEPDRASILETECPDPELRSVLEPLLAADAAGGTDILNGLDAAAVIELLEESGLLAETVEERERDEMEGQTLGEYRIRGRLGRGGMGSVYEARRNGDDRSVALKLLSRRLVPSSRAAERFLRETLIAGNLEHPNVTRVHERGEADGLQFYTMELVEGGSLADVILNLRRTGADERVPAPHGTAAFVRWAVTLIAAAARALEYVHGHGVVHRDVKPGNLLFDRASRSVKLSDFGLAMSPRSGEGSAGRLTTEGRVLGTPTYMAPEQLRGDREAVGAATDVYALAVTLYELLTLEPPYDGPDSRLDVGTEVVGDRRTRREIERILGRALRADPADRHPSAASFAEDLERVLDARR